MLRRTPSVQFSFLLLVIAVGFGVRGASLTESQSDLPQGGATGNAGGICPLGGAPYTLEFASISDGGGAFDDGSMIIVGQTAPGFVSNGQYTLEVGAVPALLHLTTGTGDANDDGTIGLIDFATFAACANGPHGDLVYSCCWRMDSDRDNDVDISDFQLIQAKFAGD